MKKEIKYCPYCGNKLRHVFFTDINTPLVCKMCKKFSMDDWEQPTDEMLVGLLTFLEKQGGNDFFDKDLIVKRYKKQLNIKHPFIQQIENTFKTKKMQNKKPKKLSEFEANVQCLVTHAVIARQASGSWTMAEEFINKSGFTDEEKQEAIRRIH